jgi:hypothetical protein
MRIPRKLKKKYKKIWEARQGCKLLISKESIEKDNGFWGCFIYPKSEKKIN